MNSYLSMDDQKTLFLSPVVVKVVCREVCQEDKLREGISLILYCILGKEMIITGSEIAITEIAKKKA